MTIPLPPANAIATLLGDLIGRTVQATTGTAAKFEPALSAVGSYVDEAQALRAVVTCDLPVGGSLGAALVVIPPGAVDDCVKARELDDSLNENLYEVLNVLSAVFPKHGAPRLVFRELARGTAIADDVKAVIAKPGKRLDLDVSVAGYRKGKLSILTV